MPLTPLCQEWPLPGEAARGGAAGSRKKVPKETGWNAYGGIIGVVAAGAQDVPPWRQPQEAEARLGICGIRIF